MRPGARALILKAAAGAAVLAGVAAGLVLMPMSGRPAAAAAPGGLTVVELFTSQGCSSCPPADANLAAIADRPNILALSFGVTYWDQLGWKDTFARPAYTERQKSYAYGLKHNGLATPEIVVDGRADVTGIGRAELEGLIARERLAGGPAVAASATDVTVGAGGAPRGGADVWLVRYDPQIVHVPIARGENSGRTLPLKHVVRSLTRLGRWSGQAVTYRLPAAAPGLNGAVLVQTTSGGPILSALKL